MTQAEAIEKIKKLLKNKGRTEAEADTAQILAAAMAAKHGIDIAALDTQEEMKRNEITHMVVGEWSRMPAEATYASVICTRFFEVNSITLAGFFEQEVFVGTQWHLQIAEYIFKYLVKELRWLWNKKRGRCKKRTEFIYGSYRALLVKLLDRFKREFDSTELEISFAAKREAYLKAHWPAHTTSSLPAPKNTGAAIHHGWIAGKDIEIRPGVKEGERKQPARMLEYEDRLYGRLIGNGGGND